MVGGFIQSIKPLGGFVWRIYCKDRDNTECTVRLRARPSELPPVGAEIWWQAGKVYAFGDTVTFEKVGNSS